MPQSYGTTFDYYIRLKNDLNLGKLVQINKKNFFYLIYLFESIAQLIIKLK